MLGENHSLQSDFPEYKAIIEKLIENDSTFANETKQYNAIDKEIRKLELNGAPTTDDTLHQMKHERAALKDTLYGKLQAAQ
jgi:uncharacterized protein YdcH (DUF465 family)